MSQFDSYRIYYHSAPQYDWQVMLDLYMGSTPVGRALFMKSGRPIPANFMMPGGKPCLHYSISDFHNMMLILVMDKPLYVSLVAANGIGAVSTSGESIGDLDRT